MAKNNNRRKPKQVKPVNDPGESLSSPWPWARSERYVCPYLIASCKSVDDHYEHPPLVEMVADQQYGRYKLNYMYADGHFGHKEFTAVTQREDFRGEISEGLAQWVRHGGRFAGQSWWAKTQNSDLSPFEVLVQVPDLPAKTLKALSLTREVSPEGALLFMEQNRVNDLMVANLMVATRFQLPREDYLSVFRSGSDQLRVAAALVDLREDWDIGDVLLREARVLLNGLNRDRRVGIEMVEGLAKDWHGSLDEFPATIRALM